jgi:hypothetical protein
MDLRKIGWEFVNSIHVVQDRNQWRVLVNTGCIKGGEFFYCLTECVLWSSLAMCISDSSSTCLLAYSMVQDII